LNGEDREEDRKNNEQKKLFHFVDNSYSIIRTFHKTLQRLLKVIYEVILVTPYYPGLTTLYSRVFFNTAIYSGVYVLSGLLEAAIPASSSTERRRIVPITSKNKTTAIP